MQSITVKELVAAVRGTLVRGSESAVIRAVSTDSRTVREGELFIPVKGERFDGHDYIESALQNGAAGCLFRAEREPENKVADKIYIAVDDPLLALKRLGIHYRDRADIPFIQITGSVGKTTTKEMVAGMLAGQFCTIKTEGNFNSDLGVPKTMLELTGEHEVAVIETGMDHFGEIRYLGEIVKPQIAVITNVGDVHAEFLGGTREGVFRAKCEIFENLAPDGVAILNGDDALLNTVTLPQRIVRCGRSGSAPWRRTGCPALPAGSKRRAAAMRCVSPCRVSTWRTAPRSPLQSRRSLACGMTRSWRGSKTFARPTSAWRSYTLRAAA